MTCVCVATPNLGIYSETFIRRHIELLPFDIATWSGRRLDHGDDSFLFQTTLGQRSLNLIKRKVGISSLEQFENSRRMEWLTRRSVDVVLAEFGMTGVSALNVCRRLKIPIVVHFHGYDAHNRDVVNGIEYRKLFNYCSAIIGVSERMCEVLVSDLGAPANKVHHVVYSVDQSSFERATPEKNAPILLAVGRFVEKKAPHLTILAFKNVLNSMPDAKLEFVGDGVLLGACRWLVRSLGIENSVTFHGYQNHAWVRDRMQDARAFVQHSVEAFNGDSEGTPVAVLEAQSSGLPVIATNHAGIKDVVVHGETGWLCSEGNTDQMSENMVKVLCASPQDLNQMSVRARDRMVREYSDSKTIGKLENVLRDAASDKS